MLYISIASRCRLRRRHLLHRLIDTWSRQTSIKFQQFSLNIMSTCLLAEDQNPEYRLRCTATWSGASLLHHQPCRLYGEFGVIGICLRLPKSAFTKVLSSQSWHMPMKPGLYSPLTWKGWKHSTWNANDVIAKIRWQDHIRNTVARGIVVRSRTSDSDVAGSSSTRTAFE